MQVNSERGGTHWLKCNLWTHRLLSDDDELAFFFKYLHLYAYSVAQVAIQTVNSDWRTEEEEEPPKYLPLPPKAKSLL